MGRFLLWKSRSVLCKQLESDIWNYCSLNMFKFSKALRFLFKNKFDKKSSANVFTNIFYKSDKSLKKLFSKRKSYFWSIIILKRKIRFFFGFPSSYNLKCLFASAQNISLSFSSKLVSIFERRLDFCVWRLRLAYNLILAIRLIRTIGFYVNGLLCSRPGILVSIGSILEVSSDQSFFYYLSQYRFWYGEFMRVSGYNARLRSSLFSLFLIHNYLLKSVGCLRTNFKRLSSIILGGFYKKLRFFSFSTIRFNSLTRIFSTTNNYVYNEILSLNLSHKLRLGLNFIIFSPLVIRQGGVEKFKALTYYKRYNSFIGRTLFFFKRVFFNEVFIRIF